MTSDRDLVLRPRRSEQLLLLGICATFVALTFLPDIRESEAAMMWFARFGFGLGVLIFTLQLLPHASFLRLTPDGFEVRSLFRGGFIRWSDVESFFVTPMPGSTFVGMRFSEGFDRLKAGRRVASALTGGAQGILPDTYGRKVEDLAALMEEWRIRHSSAG